MEREKATVVKCQACKRGMNNTQIGLLVVSAYILVSSIYGTIELIKNLIGFFN